MAGPAVLDSSAVLAVIFNEAGNDLVAPLIGGALLSTVNLAEIHSRLIQRGSLANFAWNRLITMGCEIHSFTEQHARIAAELVRPTKPYGLSLGDRACLALAIERKAKVFTTDRAWKNLGLGIEVEVIR